MTIESTDIRSLSYLGNGSNTDFPVTFPFTKTSSSSSDLLVYLTLISDGTEDLQTEVDNYTVSGGSLTGSPTTGTVTFVTAPATGYRVTIIGNEPELQRLDLVEGGDLPAENIERALDKLTLQIQDLGERLTRAILATPGSNITDILISSPVAGYLAQWDSTATVLQSVNPSTLVTDASILTINDLTTSTDIQNTIDYVPIYDVSAGSNRKVLVSTLIPSSAHGLNFMISHNIFTR